jgi:hypothetical protein
MNILRFTAGSLLSPVGQKRATGDYLFSSENCEALDFTSPAAPTKKQNRSSSLFSATTKKNADVILVTDLTPDVKVGSSGRGKQYDVPIASNHAASDIASCSLDSAGNLVSVEVVGIDAVRRSISNVGLDWTFKQLVDHILMDLNLSSVSNEGLLLSANDNIVLTDECGTPLQPSELLHNHFDDISTYYLKRVGSDIPHRNKMTEILPSLKGGDTPSSLVTPAELADALALVNNIARRPLYVEDEDFEEIAEERQSNSINAEMREVPLLLPSEISCLLKKQSRIKSIILPLPHPLQKRTKSKLMSSKRS